MFPGGDTGNIRGYVVVVLLGVLVIAALLLPQLRQLWLKLRAEEVTISRAEAPGHSGADGGLDLEIITILGKDGIPAILDPQFVSGAEADGQMLSNERVLAVSLNGDHRAYPLNMLSRHEIVNDTVGGVPIAVTW